MGRVFVWAVIVAICATLGWMFASGGIARGAQSPLARVVALVDAHHWRDGSLHRGRFAGCRWQARVFRDGHGYAGVTCGGLSGVALRYPSGRWAA